MEDEPTQVEPVTHITTMCPECGTLIEVTDPAAVLRALHLVNNCQSLSAVFAERPAL